MPHKSAHNLLQQRMTRREFIGFTAVAAVSLVGITKVLSELRSHASGTPIGFEAEDGTITGPAAKSTSTSASAGSVVKFGPAATNFELGTTKPDASNTGVIAGAALTVFNGDKVLTSPTLLENLDIYGFVAVRSAGVIIRNCRIRGRENAGKFFQTGLIECSDAGVKDLIIERCTLLADYPRYWQNGINGANFTATRCNVSRVCDGIDPKGNNFAVDGCYIHDLAFFDGSTGTDHGSDTRFPGWTHNDGLQLTGGDNGRIRGNNIQAYFAMDAGTPQTAVSGTTSGSNGGRTFPGHNYANGITISLTASTITNLSISQNWFEGGEDSIQMPAQNKGYDSGNSVTVSGNRFGLDQKPGYTGNPVNPRYVIRTGITGSIVIDSSSNVYDNVSSVPTSLIGKPISNTTTI